MSNEIDLIVGTEAFTQLNNLLLKLGEVDAEFGKIAIKFSNLGKGGVTNSAELDKVLAQNATLNSKLQELTKSYDTLNKQIEDGTAKLAKRGKLVTQEVIDTRALNKELTQQFTETSKVTGAYAQLDAQYKQSIKLTQDLAASNKQNTQEYKNSLLATTEIGNQLKKIDSDVGKHTRNVGNYASSWNGLGNSVNQLTREAPAFANSVNTGFMALSNNLPILADEIGQVIAKNKILTANGEKTSSVFSQVAGAFFSWQTLMSLGVTLLTVYGGKLIELATSGNKASQAQKKLNEELSNTTNAITPQMAQLSSLVDIVNSSTESEKNRQLAYEEIKKTLPGLTSATYSQAIAIGELKIATDLYISSLIQQQLVEIEAKSIAEEQTKLNQETAKSTKERIGWFGRLTLAMSDNEKGSLDAIKKIKDAEDKASQDAINLRKKDLISKQEDFLETQKLLKPFVTDPSKSNKDAKKEAEEKAKLEEERLKKHYETLLSDAERQKEIDKDALESFHGGLQEKSMLSAKFASDEIAIANLVFEEKKRLAKGDVELVRQATNEKKTAEENAGQENIKRVTKFYSDFFKKADNSLPKTIFGDKYKLTEEQKADLKKHEDEVKKTADEMKNYLSSFGTEFASKAGFSETFNMLSGNIAGFGTDAKVTFIAVAESAQEMFNMISESSQSNFDAEYARLDKQKNAALEFAGTSEVAKAKIEEDFAKKKHEIEVRQFKEKQKITIANIAIDTAQAIVSTWAQVPKFDFGLSATALSVMIGAMGAVQAGIVLSQKPPAYADGTDNHGGGLMLVNDGSGSNFEEKVILPSGKVIRPQGRNVLMDAPKGTKVLNHEQQLFEMLQNNNISMSEPIKNGLTYEEMDEIFKSNFGNIKTQNTIFDKNGFQSYVKNGNSITRSNSNRSQAIGISV